MSRDSQQGKSRLSEGSEQLYRSLVPNVPDSRKAAEHETKSAVFVSVRSVGKEGILVRISWFVELGNDQDHEELGNTIDFVAVIEIIR